jgi:transposase
MRLAEAKHAASYAGLVPSTYHSGEREAYGRITKRWSGELRTVLCEVAHHEPARVVVVGVGVDVLEQDCIGPGIH